MVLVTIFGASAPVPPSPWLSRFESENEAQGPSLLSHGAKLRHHLQ
jgi:hypothetical protein